MSSISNARMIFEECKDFKGHVSKFKNRNKNFMYQKVNCTVLYCLHDMTTVFTVDYISAIFQISQCADPDNLIDVFPGVKGLMPWNNIMGKKSSFFKLPPNEWDDFLDPNEHKKDKTNDNGDVNCSIKVNINRNNSITNTVQYMKDNITSAIVLHNKSSSVLTGCQLDYGSISRMPSVSTCVLHQHDQDNKTKMHQTHLAACDVVDNVVLFSTQRCSHSPIATTLAYFKVAWLLAKFNYVLVLSTILCVLLPNTRSRLIGQNVRTSQSVYAFIIVNAVWMIWRLQETLHWDTKWQNHVPYICVATNTIRYLMEGVALFLFACTSLERYQAIAGSLLSYVSGKKVKQAAIASSVGIVVGLISSILNIVALYMMGNSSVLLKTCSVPHNMSMSLMPLIVAKVVSLVAMYLVPCSIMATANCAMSSIVRRRTSQNLGRCYSKKQRDSSKKTNIISSFLVLSSVFMVCCVSKPLYELYVVITISTGGSVKAELGTMLLDAITWNLTTIAYTINTALGLRYTK